LFKAEDFSALNLALLKKVQIFAGSPLRSFEQIYLLKEAEKIRSLFDFVIEIENFANFRLFDLKRKTMQRRVQTEKGLTCLAEVAIDI
jgi:hypothetical protein